MVLEKTLESPLDCKEIQPVHSEGDQPWDFFGGNVNCLVLCRTELDPELLKIETKTCIISTPCDAYRATRLIFQSAPIGRICRTKDLVCFHLNDRLDHVKEQVLKYRESCYPILDENDIVSEHQRFLDRKSTRLNSSHLN